MTATPLPESGQTIPSLPRSLYLGAHDQPHWSKISDAPDGRRKADGVRSVEVTRRQRQLAAIHDSLHHLRASATAIGNLDRNGLTLAAADNIETSLEHTASCIASLVADMRKAAAVYTEAEILASTPPPPPEETVEEMLAKGYRYVCKEHDFYIFGAGTGDVAEEDETDRAIEEHEQQHLDEADLAEREAEDLEAAADARAADQVMAALATRTAPTPHHVDSISKRQGAADAIIDDFKRKAAPTTIDAEPAPTAPPTPAILAAKSPAHRRHEFFGARP